jgi:hypothetical protein
MNFHLTLQLILGELQKNHIEYGLVGGLALGILGIDRATTDIDFLVKNTDKDLVRKIMVDLKYESVFQSMNFSLFQSPLKEFGEIDFIHPNSVTILEILNQTLHFTIYENSLPIKVVKPEDLILLKLQAIKLDPNRKIIDERDIISLINIYDKEIDKERLIRLAVKLEMKDYILNLLGREKNE